MTEPLKIGVIQGSIREGRFNDVLLYWVTTQLSERGFETHRIDPAAPDLLPLQTGDAIAERTLRSRLAGLDGFVVITPEYNHGAPGHLKTLIDAARDEWAAKPVGLISYGGRSRGLRAIESLRPVFAGLHAVALRDTVSFASPWSHFSGDGSIGNPEHAALADASMAILCDRLDWWARSLLDARNRTPFHRRAA